MKGYIYNAYGEGWSLPTFLSWDISHGFCSPCDSFEVSFLFQPEMLTTLRSACRFRAEHEGKTVFEGVVDELELFARADGSAALLRGRGNQARMLDSEAESADYYGADLDFILGRHGESLGIEKIDKRGYGGQAASLSVSSGESHWSVFSRFAEFCLGLKPRFSPGGVLVLDGMSGGAERAVDSRTPVTELVMTQDRYGAVSRCLVKNRRAGSSTAVENEKAAALGLRAERVVNVPRSTGFDAMRHTGEYQIQKSMEDFFRVSLTLPEAFAAFPGDKLQLSYPAAGLSGRFWVKESRCICDGDGCVTVLELREEE